MTDINRLTGFLINPLDIAGVAILISDDPRVVARYYGQRYTAPC